MYVCMYVWIWFRCNIYTRGFLYTEGYGGHIASCVRDGGTGCYDENHSTLPIKKKKKKKKKEKKNGPERGFRDYMMYVLVCIQVHI